MDYDETPVSRYSTTIRFVAIAAVLVILLILGLVFSKRIVANMTDQPTKTASTTSDKKAAEKKKAEQEKQAATNKATQQKQQEEKAAKKQATATKQAETAKKQADEQKAKEVAAAQQAASQTAAATTAPGSVASTGPEDTILYTFAVAALGYAVAIFVRSRQSAQE